MKSWIWGLCLCLITLALSLAVAHPAAAGQVKMPLFQSPLPLPPKAPSYLSASDVSDTEIGLGWNDNSNNELGFWVQRSTNAYTWATIMWVPASAYNWTWYIDGGLSCNIYYYYRVTACNAYGCSPYSNIAWSKTMGCSGRP